jgi:hypothetical protein
MSRRSISNDRYRVEQKGKTRKSASSAKPKREAGATATPAKRSAKSSKSSKSSIRAKLFGRGPAREPSPAVVSTPEMKRLRKYWWVAMGFAIVIAVAMVPISKYGIKTLDSVLFGLYAAALGGALYLEFGPLRKARLAAMAEAKAKGGKSAKAPSKSGTATKAAAVKDAAPVAVTPQPQSLSGKVLQFFVGKPKPPASDDTSGKPGDGPEEE